MTGPGSASRPVRIVLADANILYSRVLRDYVLYAAEQLVITVAWSPEILREATEHMKENVRGFDDAAAARLVSGMNTTFPAAQVEPSQDAYERLASVRLPDENDRHVLAAAITAEATVLCTNNTSDFPPTIVDALGLEVLTPDDLLTKLIRTFQPQMLAAHHTTVAALPGATDASTVTALRKSGARHTADLMAALLGIS